MLIRLPRKIAQGSRLLLDLLGEAGQGREEEVLHRPKIPVAEAVVTKVMQTPCFPGCPGKRRVLSPPGRPARCSVSCRAGPVHRGFLSPSFLSSWRIFTMMKILVSPCWAERPKSLTSAKAAAFLLCLSSSLLQRRVFLRCSVLALTHGYLSCDVPYHRAQGLAVMASKCTPRSSYFSLQT